MFPLKSTLSSIILLLLFGILPIVTTAQASSVQASKGIIDLSKASFKDQSFKLNGEWRFYWKQLLQPDAINKTNASSYVQFPTLWNNTILNGKNIGNIGYATYAATVILPSNHQPLAIKVPDVYTSYALYVNGILFSNNGLVATSAAQATPYWESKTLLLPQSDTLQLVLQVSNFSHAKGGPYSDIYIGDKDLVFLQQSRSSSSDFFLTGLLLMGGLFFFGLYLFGQKDKAILYFALFCIVYSYRIVGAAPYSLHHFFPGLPWQVTIRFEYVALYAAVLFYLLHIKYLYPKDNNKWVLRSMITICFLFLASVLLLPPVWFTQFINAFLCIVFINLFYILFVYIKAVKNKRAGSAFALASAGIIILIGTLSNLDYFNVLSIDVIMINAGYFLFLLFQSLILSFRFAHSLKKAKLLAEDGLKAKSQFLSTMSHEIRTPLNSVIGMAHLMLRNKPREDQKESLEVMLFSANNLLAIVNDILDFNKIEAGKFALESIETDLYSIAKNTVNGFKTYAAEKGISLILEFDPKLNMHVLSDPTRTAQVITNLVHNAIKFTPKGSVTLSLVVNDVDEQKVTITFSVQDTGIGIPTDKQKLIFEQFTQADSSTSRSFGGTGLGLAICKSILEKQGTALHLQSEAGKGSVFFFTQTLPICLHTNETEELIVEEMVEPLKGKRILLVEDSEFNILVARKFLEDWGAVIDVAMNGQEALQMFDEHKHNLILMDLNMPVMDGYAATAELRKRGVKHPIIALTASIPNSEKEDIVSLGCTDIILKPFNPNVFINTLMLHLKPKNKHAFKS